MNKKWMPVVVVVAVVAVGLLLFQVLRTTTGADEAPSPDALVNTIPKPPPGADKNFGPVDPRVSQGPADMMQKR